MNKKIELRMLKQDTLDDLKFHFDDLSYLYKKENTVERMNFFKENSIGTNIYMDVPDLDFGEDFKESDLVNAKLVYESLKNISQLMASDFRVWSYLCATVFYDYVYHRFTNDPTNQKKFATMSEDDLVKKFIVPFSYKTANGLSRSLETNYISRLWIVGHVCEKNGDYSLLNTFKALPGKVTQMRVFFNNKNLAQIILETLLDFCDKEQGRDYADRPTFELCFKQANIISSSRAIDLIPEDVLKKDIYNMMLSSSK